MNLAAAAAAASAAAVAPFEGSEKRLELHFCAGSGAPAAGLRALPRAELDRLLALAACEIVSHTRGDAVDAYVLSESSLFVYPCRWVIKTCGTTRLLSCLEVRAAYPWSRGSDSGPSPARLLVFHRRRPGHMRSSSPCSPDRGAPALPDGAWRQLSGGSCRRQAAGAARRAGLAIAPVALLLHTAHRLPHAARRGCRA